MVNGHRLNKDNFRQLDYILQCRNLHQTSLQVWCINNNNNNNGAEFSELVTLDTAHDSIISGHSMLMSLKFVWEDGEVVCMVEEASPVCRTKQLNHYDHNEMKENIPQSNSYPCDFRKKKMYLYYL